MKFEIGKVYIDAHFKDHFIFIVSKENIYNFVRGEEDIIYNYYYLDNPDVMQNFFEYEAGYWKEVK